ncbi:YajQ family cyclic di-GMP-binding protein [bacterium]|nr:YajQ family cyclic di-GMP-binding protein [bacterium]
MPSFDVVNEIDIQEVDNAVNTTNRTIQTRFDFRDSKTEITLNKKDKLIQITTESEMRMKSIEEMFIANFLKRQLDPKCLVYKEIKPTSNGMVKREVLIKEGIEKLIAQKIVKIIKEKNLKVQTAIQDEQVRVTGKKIDDLQEVMRTLKSSNLEVPLQFTNLKS